MYNAANKLSLGLTLALSALGVLSSCGPSAEERAAAELLGQAEGLYDMKEYQSAIDSIKALNERYPKFADIRKSGLRIQAQATESLVKDSIEAIEPVLAESTLRCDSLQGLFTEVKASAEGIDGYYVPKSTGTSTGMDATGIQPRVSTEGYFYLAANISGRTVGLNRLKISAGNESWTSQPVSATRILTVEGSEIASLSPEEVAGLGPWLAGHGAKGLKGTFEGSRGTVSFAVSPALRERIMLCEEYATALQTKRSASIQREKLERKLQSVRDYLANLPLPSQD